MSTTDATGANYNNCSCCYGNQTVANRIIALSPPVQCSANATASQCYCRTTRGANNNVTRLCNCTGEVSSFSVPNATNITIPTMTVASYNLNFVNNSRCECTNATVPTGFDRCQCCAVTSVYNAPPAISGCVAPNVQSSCSCVSSVDPFTLRQMQVCNCNSNTTNVTARLSKTPFGSESRCNVIDIVNGTQKFARASCCSPKSILNPPAQACLADAENQFCQCDAFVNATTKASMLRCNCSKPINSTFTQVSRNVSFLSQQCGCNSVSEVKGNATLNYQNCSCCFAKPIVVETESQKCPRIAALSDVLTCACSG